MLHERREGEPLNLKQLWTAALGELQVGLSRAQYDTWFKDTQVLSEEDDVFLIGLLLPALSYARASSRRPTRWRG